MKRILFTLSFCLLVGGAAWSKAFLRWTEPVLPPRGKLGISELVIPWNNNSPSFIHDANRRGYRVYLELSSQQAMNAVPVIGRQSIAGLVISAGDEPDPAAVVNKIRATYPKMKVLFQLPGKQPQMRGQTVVTRDGILQVSSATAQPWLDSNLAMIRFHQAFDQIQVPLYTFSWQLSDSLEQQTGPTIEDYALAIVESGSLHADLVLHLHESLQKGLVSNQAVAWKNWQKLLACLRFTTAAATADLAPWSDVGALTDDYETAYEPMNLMARHNIPFRVLHGDVTEDALSGLKLIAVFTPPGQAKADALRAFANNGGTVVMVDVKGSYAWRSSPAIPIAEHALAYSTGRGRVIELTEPVGDPEIFAADLRRLIGKDLLISLWNALTTIAVPYRNRRTGALVIELVNYALEPMRIQVEVKGAFSQIRYETPERGCCQNLSVVKHGPFTEFIIPSLIIAGRVHLEPDLGKLTAGK
ncbi:MAG: hypothetical protein JO249_24770 [Acidobacteria bacterium]|nr:hypothetical protein [Acidobacteriota bacterium]